MDGQTPKSSTNEGRVHPGSPGETTGARAPSFSRGVQRDRARGEPRSRAIGGQTHRAGQIHPTGGLYLLRLVLSSLVWVPVGCRSTGYQPKGALTNWLFSGTQAEGRHLRPTAFEMSLPTLRTAASTRGRVSQNSRSLDASGGPTLGQRIRSRAPLLPVRGRSPPNDGGVVDLEGGDVESREDGVAEPYREPPPSHPGSPPPVPSSSVSAVSVRSSSSRATRISTRERLAQSEAESRAL